MFQCALFFNLFTDSFIYFFIHLFIYSNIFSFIYFFVYLVFRLFIFSFIFFFTDSGPQLVQMYIGDGAKLVRDAFDLAKEKILKEGRKVSDTAYSSVSL